MTVMTAKEKDEEERRQKKEEYAEFMSWTHKGVLTDLATIHHITKPTLGDLLTIAQTLAGATGCSLGRQEKRHKPFLIGWFNKNYETIGPSLRKMVLEMDGGALRGPMSGKWENYRRENPDAESVKYATGECAES
jgi:hypothetical protein